MARSQKDHTAINIEKFKSPSGSLMVDKLSWSPNASIFRTPEILSKHNEKVYKPNAFSFGPFHFGDKQLDPAQDIKLNYLQGLLHRGDPVADPEEQYRRLFNAISSVKKEACECYAGAVESSKEKVFVEIMVLDGCFIIELFRKIASEAPVEEDDPLFSMLLLRESVKHDLILLENQIPWLVLDRLFDLTVPCEGKPLIQLALDYFGNIVSSEPPRKLSEFETIKIKHILALLRHSLLLPLREDHDKKLLEITSEWEPLPCATKMTDAGIKFKRVHSNSIFDVRFSYGVFEVPSLVIHEITDTILGNLIIFEQCCSNYLPIVTSYAKLMDNLIKTDKDVLILGDNGILENRLNPEDAKKMLNKLCNDVYVTRFCYGRVGGQVTSYLRGWWPAYRSIYWHYFTTPLIVFTQLVTLIGLVLTFMQTIFAGLDALN